MKKPLPSAVCLAFDDYFQSQGSPEGWDRFHDACRGANLDAHAIHDALIHDAEFISAPDNHPPA